MGFTFYLPDSRPLSDLTFEVYTEIDGQNMILAFQYIFFTPLSFVAYCDPINKLAKGYSIEGSEKEIRSSYSSGQWFLLYIQFILTICGLKLKEELLFAT